MNDKRKSETRTTPQKPKTVRDRSNERVEPLAQDWTVTNTAPAPTKKNDPGGKEKK